MEEILSAFSLPTYLYNILWIQYLYNILYCPYWYKIQINIYKNFQNNT